MIKLYAVYQLKLGRHIMLNPLATESDGGLWEEQIRQNKRVSSIACVIPFDMINLKGEHDIHLATP